MSDAFCFVILLVLYLLPTLVAHIREHDNAMAITMLNVAGGWTVVGWIVALTWSFAE